MFHRIRALKKNVLGLVLILGMSAVLVPLLWYSVQADDRPAAGTFELPAVDAEAAAPAEIQAGQATSMTVFLPLVVRNDGLQSPLFGMQMGSINKAGGLDEVLKTTTYWVRLSPFDWDKIEPTRTNPPTYNWDVVDKSIQGENLINASRSGLEVIALVRFAPEWAQKYQGHYCGPFKPEAMEAWGQFMRELVSRYSKEPYNVKNWELGNEPDIDHVLVGSRNGYGCWGDFNDPYYGGGAYAEMLKTAYKAIKSADPEATVLNGGLLLDCDPRPADGCTGTAHGKVPSRFLEGILLAGGGDYFDILSFHAYADYREAFDDMGSFAWEGATTVPAKADFVRSVLTKYGYGDKPLLNTEAALRCETPSAACSDIQANYIPLAYADAMVADLVGQVYFAIINDHWYNTGLLNPDLSHKPAYESYKAASERLGTAVYLSKANGYPQGIEGYTFRKEVGTGFMDLIWSPNNVQTSVTLPANAMAYDRDGTHIATGGVISIDRSPVYVDRP